MIGKSRVVKWVSVGVVALVAILILASCAAAPAPESKRMPEVLVIPNIGAPRATVVVVGADFEPGQKVKVTMTEVRGPAEFPTQYVLVTGEGGEQFWQVDAHGSFQAKLRIPKEEGVWPIRIYDEKGKLLASTLVYVKSE